MGLRLLVVASLVALAALPGLARAAAGPAPAVQDAATDREAEKALRDTFRDGVASSDESARAEAVRAYGQGTRGLADGGRSPLVARTLGDALGDERLAVRAAALVELSWGRDPDTVLELLGEQLEELRNEVEKGWTRPDEESRARVAEARRLFRQCCEILGRHSDDRTVELLADELGKLRRAASVANSAEAFVGPLAEALLALGSHDAVETVVRTTDVFAGATLSRPEGRASARPLHDALAAFAERIGQAPPDFDDRYDQGWREWWKRHEDGFPKELGKLKEPVAAPAYEAPDRDPYRRRPGKPERP